VSQRHLVKSLSTAIVVVDFRLRIVFVNHSAETLLGVSERHLLGHCLGDVLLPSEPLESLCRRSLDTGLAFRLREFACRASMRSLMLDCRINPYEDGETVLLEMYDTTFERRLRQESELIAQQKVSRAIVRQLAHEVKNPLGGMRGAAQLLQRQLHNGPLTQYTRVIIDEIDRLAALVDSILQPGGKLALKDCNPHEVTEQVARLVEAELPAGVKLVRDYDPSLPVIRIDRNQMIQALLNLVRNAMQAVGDSGTIVLRTRAQNKVHLGQEWHRLVLCIEVEDDGPGIPTDLLENIFYPLVTGRSSGTGLGLTIAQELVAHHKGLIDVESEPGATRFTIRLPCDLEPNDMEEVQR